jgi:hypothetical protein
VADELVESSPEDILLSEKIDNFDIAETVLFLAGLGPYAVVHQVIVDHLGLNGHEAWEEKKMRLIGGKREQPLEVFNP